jgi:predicted nucleotidyltransferase
MWRQTRAYFGKFGEVVNVTLHPNETRVYKFTLIDSQQRLQEQEQGKEGEQEERNRSVELHTAA